MSYIHSIDERPRSPLGWEVGVNGHSETATSSLSGTEPATRGTCRQMNSMPDARREAAAADARLCEVIERRPLCRQTETRVFDVRAAPLTFASDDRVLLLNDGALLSLSGPGVWSPYRLGGREGPCCDSSGNEEERAVRMAPTDLEPSELGAPLVLLRLIDGTAVCAGRPSLSSAS